MATFKRFEDIEIWQLARTLASSVYTLTRLEPFARDFGLRDQIQRAAVSVGSNIAEGFERSGNKEFVKFLWIAKGSVGEVRSQCYTALDVGYMAQADFDTVAEQCRILAVKIYHLIETLSNSDLHGHRYNLSNPSNPSNLSNQ